MTDINYLTKLEKLRQDHQQVSLIIQDKVDAILNNLDIVFDKNEEFIKIGLPFMQSVSAIVDDYVALYQVYPALNTSKEFEVQHIQEGIFALCENWFINRDIHEEYLESHFPRKEFDKNTSFFKQFLKDNNIDSDNLRYWNYIY